MVVTKMSVGRKALCLLWVVSCALVCQVELRASTVSEAFCNSWQADCQCSFPNAPSELQWTATCEFGHDSENGVQFCTEAFQKCDDHCEIQADENHPEEPECWIGWGEGFGCDGEPLQMGCSCGECRWCEWR